MGFTTSRRQTGGGSHPITWIALGTRAATRAMAVFDWELASLGRPEEDVAHWLYMGRFLSQDRGVPRLPGLPGRDETVAFYEARSGRYMEDLGWWEVYSAWRLASETSIPPNFDRQG